MANTITNYTDAQIMKALLTHDFSGIGRSFIDDVITSLKPGAFYMAENLDIVQLPAVEKIGSKAFYQSSISSLTIDWSKITSIGHDVFYRSFDLMPATLTLSKLTALGNGAFCGQSAHPNERLQSVSLPLWTGSGPSEVGLSSGFGSFAYCTALKSISAPLLTTLSSQFLANCTALEEVAFPKVASYQNGVFTGCTALKKIDLGGAITSMSTTLLPAGNNSKVETLILRGVTAVPTLGSSSFNNTPVARGTAYIYVPKDLLATFQVAANWSTYKDQIRAIEDYPDICGS